MAPAPTFDHSVTGYRLEHVYWLVRAAKLAYDDEAAIRATTAEWGFDRQEFFRAELGGSFPIDDTQAFAAGSDQMVIVAFRGTEPTQIKDWLTDVNSLACRGPAGKGFVHEGFSRALDSIYPQVRETVQRFRDAGQSLWFTGHSLGGALAMLASARMHFEDPNLLPDGVYTFGQPRTCDRLLADPYNEAFSSRAFRFVNNNDVVAQMPPEPVFHHVDEARYFDHSGKLHDRMSLTGGLADRFSGLTGDVFAPGTDGVRDHFIDHYVAAVEKNLT